MILLQQTIYVDVLDESLSDRDLSDLAEDVEERLDLAMAAVCESIRTFALTVAKDVEVYVK